MHLFLPWDQSILFLTEVENRVAEWKTLCIVSPIGLGFATHTGKDKSKKKAQLRRAQGRVAELRRAPNLVSQF